MDNTITIEDNSARGINITAMSAENADIVIKPNLGTTNVLQISKKKQLIAAGEKAAQHALPKLLALLKKRHIALVLSKSI